MKLLAGVLLCCVLVVHLRTADGQTECPSIPLASRVSCAEGVTAEQCNAKGCCYDNKTSVAWCYHTPSGYVATCMALPPYRRINCGTAGITPAQCAAKGCCFDNTRKGASWCFSTPPDGDDCANSPCKNGGQCADGNYTFTCTCATGFTGIFCQTNSLCDTKPCQNGGTCAISGTSYTCSCAAGFSGKNCETNVCDAHPCLNGGTCTPSGSSYTCSCSPGFSGTDCGTNNLCDAAPCQNGGQCSPSGSSYTCSCETGFSGTTCEIKNIALKRPALQSSTYIAANGLSYAASSANDGDASTIACTDSPNYSYPWWTVDLGTPTAVYSVTVSNEASTDAAAGRLSYFAVGLSNVSSAVSPPQWLNYPSLCNRYGQTVGPGEVVTVECRADSLPARFVSIQATREAICMYEVSVRAKSLY